MLVLSGNGVSGQVAALSGLLDAAPALKPQVAEVEWVGNRRWNILFKTGQVLALPEGTRAAADALVSFARLDGTNRLLGGRVVAFDMRAADRIYLRLPGRASAAEGLSGVAQTASSAAPVGSGGNSETSSPGPSITGHAVGAVAAGAAVLSACCEMKPWGWAIWPMRPWRRTMVSMARLFQPIRHRLRIKPPMRTSPAPRTNPCPRTTCLRTRLRSRRRPALVIGRRLSARPSWPMG